MTDHIVQLAIQRLSLIAVISIAGLVVLPFAPGSPDTTIAATVLSTVIGGAVAAVAGITVPRPQGPPPRPPQ